MDQAKKRRKGVKCQTIVIRVDSRADACGETHLENGVIRTDKKVNRPPLGLFQIQMRI